MTAEPPGEVARHEKPPGEAARHEQPPGEVARHEQPPGEAAGHEEPPRATPRATEPPRPVADDIRLPAESPAPMAPPPPASAAPAAGGDRDEWLAEARRPTERDSADRTVPAGGRARRAPGRLIALGVFALVLVGIAWFGNALFQPFKGDGGETVQVTIPQGYTLSQIANRLEASGVIEGAGFFQLRARLDGASGSLRPGSYELRKDMSFAAALQALQEGVPPNVVQVAIPEGLSRAEARRYTAGLRGNYVRATRRSPELDPADYGAEGATSLEGFLFPATYELKKGQRVNRLVEKQLGSFKRNFEKLDLSYAKRRNLTAYDVLIVASLIEREALVAKERPLIASVIYNRLRDRIPLGIDATVRFVTGNWKRPLRESELANPSPYNTRIHGGLPPGPIGNPGLASIRAAAKPARTDYLFYVAAVCGNGKHKFAKTDAEFQAYVNEYNRAREARGGKSPTNC